MEWTVVIALATIVPLGIAIVKPIISLTQAITRLTMTVDNLKCDMEKITNKNTESHARIWEHNEEQDEIISEHENRITDLERNDRYVERKTGKIG